MSRSDMKFKIFVCNILISVLCVIAIAAYFFLPFWKIDVSLHISAEAFQTIISKQDMKITMPDGTVTDLSDIDFKDAFGEDGFQVNATILLQTTQVLSALSDNPMETVQAVIDENVHTFVDQLNEPLHTLARAAIEIVAKTSLKNILHSQIKDIYQDEKTAEEVEQFLHNAGINDEFIDEKTDALLDALYAENANVDSVSDTVVSMIEESMTKLSNADESKNFALSDEKKQEIKDSVSETFSQIAADDGSINVEEWIGELFIITMQGKIEGSGSPEGNAPIKSLAASPENENTEENVFETLKETLCVEIMGAIDENAANVIVKTLKIISYIILFTFFTWAYLILKIVVKLGAKNNAIKLKLPILLGSIPFWILYALPTGIIVLLKAPPVFLVSKLGGPEAAMEMMETMSMFTLKFSTCAWVSFAIGVFLFLFAFFYYRGLRKTLKNS